MLVFPLLDTPQSLLERIITKVDLKSNFRLLQTCHDLQDIIHTSPRITVNVAGTFLLICQGSSFELRRCNEVGQIDIAGCYGVRVEELSLPPKSDGEMYESLGETLKKYRITAEKVPLTQKYSNEQCSMLLKLLKPTQVRFLPHHRISSLEPILNSKRLRKVDVSVYRRDALPAMVKLLSRFSEVELTIIGMTDNFRLLHEALQTLFSSTWSKCKEFRLRIVLDHWITQEELEFNLPGMQWISVRTEEDHAYLFEDRLMRSADIEVPANFPQGSRCKITAEPTYRYQLTDFTIFYEVRDAVP